MADLIADSDELKTDTVGAQLQSSYNYWYKHRLIFNIIVGIAGLIPTLTFAPALMLFDILGIIMWGLVANAFYSVGYSVESFFIAKTNGKIQFKLYRSAAFWLGTLAYAFVSVLFAWAYFSLQTSPF
jgi:hypothetical protein